MNQILSPVDNNSFTTLEKSLATSDIINSYKNQGFDVSRFFRTLENIELRKCEKSGYRFYYPYDIFGDEQFYIDLQQNSTQYYNEGKWEHRQALNWIKPGMKILEVGCATGYFLKLATKKGAICTGLELNKIAIKEAKSHGLDVRNELLNEFSSHNLLKYDAVCSFQVLEHIWDIQNYFKSALAVLKPGGILIIGVPNNNPYLYKYDLYHSLNLPPHHAGLWNREAFMKVADCFDLKVIDIKIEKLREYKKWYLVQVNHLKEINSFMGTILLKIPRPFYKLILYLVSPFLEGRTILAVLKK